MGNILNINNDNVKLKKVKTNNFIEWFFSDKKDLLDLGMIIKKNIISTGKYSTTIQELFNNIEYIPAHLIEDYIPINSNEECSTTKCILI